VNENKKKINTRKKIPKKDGNKKKDTVIFTKGHRIEGRFFS